MVLQQGELPGLDWAKIKQAVNEGTGLIGNVAGTVRDITGNGYSPPTSQQVSPPVVNITTPSNTPLIIGGLAIAGVLAVMILRK